MSTGKKLTSALPYHVFMQRQRVLGLYRSMLRAVGRLQREDIRPDIWQQVRVEFRHNKTITDAVSLKALMTEGTRQLEVLKDMAGSPIGGESKIHPVSPVVPIPGVTSWLDSSTEDDVKGRVGEGWPWQ
jgi:hypothetical protein